MGLLVGSLFVFRCMPPRLLTSGAAMDSFLPNSMLNLVQRQQWLREALESVISAPSETDLLRAALAVLQAHAPPKGSTTRSQTEEEKTAVMTAFEDVHYFIEDLDHANGERVLTHSPMHLSAG